MKWLVLLGVLTASGLSAGWETDLDDLLLSDPGPDRNVLLEKVLEEAPDWRGVVSRIQSLRFPEAEAGTSVVRTTICTDGVERPWVLYVPSSYDHVVPTPLLVVLHGGVGRKDIIEDPETWVDENNFTRFAESEGWLALYPLGQEGATWWDDVGMSNIRNLVREVKTGYNVDDDRVWLGGFSDGASAAFLHAMVVPSDYAAFVALNGHMGVGSIAGELHTYAPNYANTPVYAVTTDRDELYPSHNMRGLIEMAREAGGRMIYRELEGQHDFAYADDELPRIARFLERHPRDPFPTEIVWETATADFGRCRWFAIDRVTTEKPAAWHSDFNSSLVDDRVVIGFLADDSYEGAGVKTGRIFEETAAEDMGLETGDVIVQGGEMRIETMEDLNDFKHTITRGDSIEVVVERDGRRVLLSGRVPGPETYYVFRREKPSALARVSFFANTVDVAVSRVGAFRLFIHPDLFRLDQNIVVRVNGETVFDERVKPDLSFLLRNYLEERDRRLLYVAEVKIEL